MKIDIEKLDGKIVIIKDEVKNHLLKLIANCKKLLNIKIITLNEFVEKFTFSYTNKTIYYVMNKYNVIYDVAKIYLDNIKYVEFGISEKSNFLLSLKKELIANNLLETNEMFKRFLNNKDIVLLGMKYEDTFIHSLFNSLANISHVTNIDYDELDYKHDVFELKNKDEEIAFIASKISELIHNGVDINNIKVVNCQDDYKYTINRIFSLFNIPFQYKNGENVFGTLIVQKFIENYSSDLKDTIEKIKVYVKSENDNGLLRKIISIVNQYAWCDNYLDVKELIISEIRLLKNDPVIYDNAVREDNFIDGYFSDNDYVFLISFNEGVFPVNYKDEDYISDKEKIMLGLSTSVMKNELMISKLKNKIKTIRNLVITYSKSNLSSELYISSLFDSSYLNLVKNNRVKLNYSDSFNKLYLVSLKDEFNKYGSKCDDLFILNEKYPNELYCSFDNNYKKINRDKLNKFLNEKLTLSYTTLNTYYNCAFRYYLDNILKLNKYEDSFATVLGTLFHKILSECFVDDYDLSLRYSQLLSEITYPLNDMERYFLNKLEEELKLIIATIKTQLGFIGLKKTLYEQEIIINISDNANIIFKGFIDKVLYDECDGENIAVIIDYKTGNPNLNIDNSFYGLDMQLPIYVYLLKNSNIIQNVRIGGFYLQKILTNVRDDKKKKESLKLLGYSNSDINVLSKVDSSYMDSNIIKSLKMSSNGFYSYSKVLTDSNIDKLSNLVEKKIIEARDKILDGDFSINPKEINQVLVGCTYCKYKDICYVTKKDVVSLDSVSKDVFLGGD